jgi:hypothetical protein
MLVKWGSITGVQLFFMSTGVKVKFYMYFGVQIPSLAFIDEFFLKKTILIECKV